MPETVSRGTPQAAIGRLLRPRSVAIVGASPTPGSLGGGVLGNLIRFGFTGDIHLVNPTRTEIDGRPCVPTTRDLPQGVDCAVLAIPQKGVMDALRGCAERGVGGVICFSSGFAEAGEEGLSAQQALADLAHDAGIAVMGPNCLGTINFVDGVALTFGAASPKPPEGPGLAIVSQSGAMATVVRAALHARDIGVTFTVSTGNEAVNGAEDFFEHLIEDPATGAFALVMEQVRQPQRFLELARRARRLGKPVLLLHPGRSAAARESAQTHTGAMAGNWQVMRSIVSRAGVCVVETLEELVDVSELVLRTPLPSVPGVAMITDSGAFKGMVLDYCEDIGVPLPQPGPQATALIGAIAPGLIHPTNPLDLTAQALIDPDLYPKTMKPLLADKNVGAICLGIIMSSPLLAHRKVDPIVRAMKELQPKKPILFTMLGEEAEVPADCIADLRNVGVPFFRSPERALRALRRVASWQMAPVAELPAPMAGRLRLPGGTIPEYKAKPLLAAAGLHVPHGILATTLEEARAAALTCGYPVALKAQSSALSHKSDVGGVILNLADADALERGWTILQDNIRHHRPDLILDGVLIEKMGARGTELILGARNDPEWGAVLMVGLGGVLAEALHDARVIPADFSAAEIEVEIRKLRAAAIFDGFRGEAPRDIAAVAEMAAALGGFVRRHPEIVEVDVNPVMVFAMGQGALALDAVIVTR